MAQSEFRARVGTALAREALEFEAERVFLESSRLRFLLEQLVRERGLLRPTPVFEKLIDADRHRRAATALETSR